VSSLALTGAGPEAGGGAFSPASLPNLVAWYKADAGTSTTTDGVAISQWNDQSGNGHHLVQATGGNQPLYKAAIQNGLPVVRFDGVDDFIQLAFAFPAPWYLFAVARFRAVYTADVNIFCGAGATPSAFYRAGGLATQIWNGTGACATYNAGTPESWHVYGVWASAGAQEQRIDGAVVATDTSASMNAPGGVAIPNAGASTSTIDAGEYILLSAQPSAGDRTSTETYLKNRWGTP